MRWLPFLTLPVAIYSLVAPFGVDMNSPLIGGMSVEELLVAMTSILLAAEIWRSTAASPATALHVVASFILLLLVVGEWFAPWNRTSTFVLLTILTGVNLVVSGYVAFVVKGQNNVWIARR